MSVTTIPAVAHSAPFPPVKITSLGFEMPARTEKAREMAAAFFKGGVTIQQVQQITPGQWKDLTADLKRARVLKPYATVPGPATIAQAVAELARLQATRRPAHCEHRLNAHRRLCLSEPAIRALKIHTHLKPYGEIMKNVATVVEQTPDWVFRTPVPSEEYRLERWVDGMTDAEDQIDLSRQEFIALKHHLARMRGYNLTPPEGSDQGADAASETEWTLPS